MSFCNEFPRISKSRRHLLYTDFEILRKEKFEFLSRTMIRLEIRQTRPDTRLPKLLAGGQGPYLRLLDHLGNSRRAKEIKS